MPRPYIAFSLILTWLLSSAGAATFSGLLLTKQSRAIAFCKLYASSDTGETRDFTTNRGGAFAVDLGNGVWTILADSEQIQKWGFAQMNVSIAITGETSLARNLTLLASEPLRTPSLTFSRPDAKT